MSCADADHTAKDHRIQLCVGLNHLRVSCQDFAMVERLSIDKERQEEWKDMPLSIGNQLVYEDWHANACVIVTVTHERKD